eukprot:7041647-Prymnesium_polylepis.1
MSRWRNLITRLEIPDLPGGGEQPRLGRLRLWRASRAGTPACLQQDKHLLWVNERAAHAEDEDAELDAEPDAVDAARIPLLQRPTFKLAVVGVSMLVVAVRYE